MRQRVLQATIITVLLAVLMLGIPLGASWLTLQSQNLTSRVNAIVDQVRIDTETRLQEGGELDEVMLQRRVDAQTDLNIAIEVEHEDEVFTAGDPPGANPISSRTTGASGQSVSVSIPRSDVRAHTASAWVLMTVAGLAALSIGVSVALWQAQRISLPLARLSRRAEEMGAGRSRGPWCPSGIAEIDDVAEELARSGAMLNERLEAESRLASDASHQLRTPLTALLMRLEEMGETDDMDVVREEAAVAVTQVERLTGVIDTLLARSKGEEGVVPEISLDSVLAALQREYQPAFTAARRTMRVDGPPGLAVRSSPADLGQILQTLIENSLAHGDGRVTITMRASAGSTVIEVQDEGEGIPAAIAPHVFERSVTSHGSGLGLGLARQLAERNGGRLELVSSHPAVFSVFLAGRGIR